MGAPTIGRAKPNSVRMINNKLVEMSHVTPAESHRSHTGVTPQELELELELELEVSQKHYNLRLLCSLRL